MRNYMKKFTKKKALSWILMASIAVSMFAGLPQEVLATSYSETATGVPTIANFGIGQTDIMTLSDITGGIKLQQAKAASWEYPYISSMLGEAFTQGVRADIVPQNVPQGHAIVANVGADAGGNSRLYGSTDSTYSVVYSAEGNLKIVRCCEYKTAHTTCSSQTSIEGEATMKPIGEVGKISIYAKMLSKKDSAENNEICVDVYGKDLMLLQRKVFSISNKLCYQGNDNWNARFAVGFRACVLSDDATKGYHVWSAQSSTSTSAVSYDVTYLNPATKTTVNVGDGVTGVTALPVNVYAGKGATLPVGYFSNTDATNNKYIKGWKQNGSALTDNKLGTDLTNITADFVDLSMLDVCAQATSSKDGKRTVRFLSTVNELTGYQKAGILLSTTNTNPTINGVGVKNHETDWVYKNVTAEGNTKSITDLQGENLYTAYSNFLIARVVKNIPTSAPMYARAYVILGNGDVVYGETNAIDISNL